MKYLIPIFVAALIGACVDASPNTPAPSPNPLVSYQHYQQLQADMSYDQAATLLGSKGSETSRDTILGREILVYAWENPNATGNIKVTFIDGKLDSKSQSKLGPDFESSSRPSVPMPSIFTVTMDEFNRIQNGMSYDDVVAVIGAEGEELSRSSIAGTTSVMYAWKNRDGGNMNALFQDGKLISKAQFGLN